MATRTEPGPEPDDRPESPPPLTPAVFHILLVLAGGEAHGYGIMQDVDRMTAGHMRLGPGTLYRSIQKMLVDGLIEELAIALHDEADDDRRRYYRLTARGRAAAAGEALRLAALVETARRCNLFTHIPNKDDAHGQPRTGRVSHHHAAPRGQRRRGGDRVVRDRARRK